MSERVTSRLKIQEELQFEVSAISESSLFFNFPLKEHAMAKLHGDNLINSNTVMILNSKPHVRVICSYWN